MKLTNITVSLACTLLLVGSVSGCGTSTLTGTVRSDDLGAVTLAYFNKLSVLVAEGTLGKVTSLRKQGKLVWMNRGTQVSVLNTDAKDGAAYIQVNSGPNKGMKLYINSGDIKTSN